MSAEVNEIQYGVDVLLEQAPELPEEERHNLQVRMEAMDALLATQKKAKYKIEVFLGKARSTHKPVPGAVTIWESGTQLHGGGDTKIYFCPGKESGKNDCNKAIPFAFNGYGHLVCPGCRTVWKGDEVIGEIMGRHSMRQWSDVLLKYFRRLDYNCDIYLKHSPTDIRSVASLEQQKQVGGEYLRAARTRALHIYPLKNIIMDTAQGADPLNRFFSFLTA